jgi:hypothetical protein
MPAIRNAREDARGIPLGFPSKLAPAAVVEGRRRLQPERRDEGDANTTVAAIRSDSAVNTTTNRRRPAGVALLDELPARVRLGARVSHPTGS